MTVLTKSPAYQQILSHIRAGCDSPWVTSKNNVVNYFPLSNWEDGNGGAYRYGLLRFDAGLSAGITVSAIKLGISYVSNASDELYDHIWAAPYDANLATEDEITILASISELPKEGELKGNEDGYTVITLPAAAITQLESHPGWLSVVIGITPYQQDSSLDRICYYLTDTSANWPPYLEVTYTGGSRRRFICGGF
jgi:hypothetical protein